MRLHSTRNGAAFMLQTVSGAHVCFSHDAHVSGWCCAVHWRGPQRCAQSMRMVHGRQGFSHSPPHLSVHPSQSPLCINLPSAYRYSITSRQQSTHLTATLQPILAAWLRKHYCCGPPLPPPNTEPPLCIGHCCASVCLFIRPPPTHRASVRLFILSHYSSYCW